MNRLTFIKNLITVSSLSALPNIASSQSSKVYLHNFYVRGFQYYEGEKLFPKMNLGDSLDLVREPNNKYDESAIAVFFQSQKIGFIPAETNETLSKLIDLNALKLYADITELNEKNPTWDKLQIGIYTFKPIN